MQRCTLVAFGKKVFRSAQRPCAPSDHFPMYSETPNADKRLAPARGVLIAAALSIVIWCLLIILVWLLQFPPPTKGP
jgi:hypothetical protein